MLGLARPNIAEQNYCKCLQAPYNLDQINKTACYTRHGEKMGLPAADDLPRLFWPSHTAFDVPQLRELIFAFTKSPENIPRARSELLNLVEEHSSDPEFARLLAKLEIIQPYRHTYLFAFTGKTALSDLVSLLDAWAALHGRIEHGKTKLNYLDYRADGYLSIRFAHLVKNFVYESVGPGMQQLKERTQRYAVVAAIKPDLNLVEIRFDGFEQTRDTPAIDKVSYADIAADCKAILESMFGIGVESLPLKAAIQEMLSKHADEVVQLKNNSRVGAGRIAIDTGDDDEGDLNVFLQNAFASKSPVDPLSSMENWTTESIVLRWKNLKIITRVDLATVTPEIFFSWKKGAEKIIRNSDQIMRRLAEHTDLAFANSRQRIATRFKSLLSNDKVLTPLELAQASNSSVDASMGYLLEQVSKGGITLKFRIATHEVLIDFANKWFSSLAELPAEVQTASGQILPLADPKNIEIGFAATEVA
ncbi:hypothetical protein [Herbaspirillum robiniae]|uniref:Uncharacterized protein n=1 Tax=Herbaspirillum robiniae TaxID=2014887 RepID=A0ABX2M5R3_9BURK|nr:hypothetical protein [Herbaspirillum robiniae]NUU04588.1 hypothetical protein [Herbaspirillum robiniae]